MFDRGPAAPTAPPDDGEVLALEAEIAVVAGVINMAYGALVRLVARAMEDGSWLQPGIHSPQHWIAWQLGISALRAKQLVAIATRAHELPATLGALEAGEISVDQASVVARHVPASHEAAAAELAHKATVAQLRRSLSKYPYEPPESDTKTTPEPGPPQPERREVSFGSTEDGGWEMRTVLPADEGAIVERALEAKRHELFHADSGVGTDAEKQRVSWADALLGMAESSLADGEARMPGADRFRVLAHLEVNPIDSTEPGGLSLHLGSPLPRALRRLLTCDGLLMPVFGRLGQPVSVGRSQHIVPERTRRLIEHRDGGCRVPGCEAKRWLQIHHIIHWEDGGPTDLWNLVALCGRHHRMHHRGLLGISGHADGPDGLIFTNARGEVLAPVGIPRPPGELPHAAPYQRPLGEAMQSDCVVLATRPASTRPGQGCRGDGTSSPTRVEG